MTRDEARRFREVEEERDRFADGLADLTATIQALADTIRGEGDEWKAHMLDGTAHLNRTYAAEYTKWKHRARTAEAKLRQTGAA